MNNILAFGDSNTWGYNAKTRGRFPHGIRWTSLLQNALENVNIIEEGLCGRTTVFEDKQRKGRRGIELLPTICETHSPLDFAIIMLGTNDCKAAYNAAPSDIGYGIEQCLDELEKYIEPRNILLVSPILLGENVIYKDREFSKVSVDTSRRLKDIYKNIAQNHGTNFLAASDFAAPCDIDDEHLDENGHNALAKAVIEKLREMGAGK